MLRKRHDGLTNGEREKLRGERDQIKFIDPTFERWQVVGLRKARRRQEVPQITCKRHRLYDTPKMILMYYCLDRLKGKRNVHKHVSKPGHFEQ